MVERAADWTAQGPLASRLERIIAQLRARSLESGITLPAARVSVGVRPEEHVGLGVGTQLSLAVARALLRLAGMPDPGPTELATLTGRGARSGIGLHGFHHGGMIVDGGRKREGSVPPLLARAVFPRNGGSSSFSRPERAAFTDLTRVRRLPSCRRFPEVPSTLSVGSC